MNKGSYFVIELLQRFDKKELKDLQVLANCSYFNTERKVFLLLNILIKKIKDKAYLTEDSLVTVYNELYQVNLVVLNKRQLNNIHAKMSLLHNLVQQFMCLESLKKSEKTKTYLLQEQLLVRKQYRSFQKFVKVQKKYLQKVERDAEFYEHQFIIEQGQLSYAQLTGTLSKQNNIASIKENLSLYYLIHQLDAYLMELYLNELTSTHHTDLSYYHALQPLLKLALFANHPLLLLYQSVIKVMEAKTDATFFQMVEDLEFYGSSIPIDNLINFYNSLLNFCVLQVRKNNTEFAKHLFSLYQKMDTKNLLLTNGQIHIDHLHNIVFASCTVEKFDWAAHMVEKYYDYLPKNIRAAVKNYNLGAIAYYQKDYQLAIDYLFPLASINLSHDINRRSLMIKAFYELDSKYEETTHTLFRSFEKYIREHKSLTSKSKTSYKNFIRTLINLYRIKHGVTKMKLENLKQKLEAQKLNSNKSWLLEKIGVLG